MNTETMPLKLEPLIQELTLQLSKIPETLRKDAVISFKIIDDAFIIGNEEVYVIRF